MLLATGGVDWGPAASVIVALDVQTLNNGLFGPPPNFPGIALNNDSAFAPMPEANPNQCPPIELATCPAGVLPSDAQHCVGRVFGQPLVVGQDVLFATSTGTLTGVGSSLAQQQGSGTIESLGQVNCAGASCGLCSIGSGAGGACLNGIEDLADNVGKVASGLSALNSSSHPGEVQVFSASTTGLQSVTLSANAAASPAYQKLLLSQWWLRKQKKTPP